MNQGAAWSSAETQKAEQLGGERMQEERNEDESPVPGSLFLAFESHESYNFKFPLSVITYHPLPQSVYFLFRPLSPALSSLYREIEMLHQDIPHQFHPFGKIHIINSITTC